MATNDSSRGKKRSKAFYRKSAYGGKRQCTGKNILEPGIRGFLVMCHSNESSAVRESYNILNEYADLLYGPDKTKPSADQQEPSEATESESGSDEDGDIEKALKKEVDGIKNVTPMEKRFQNVATKAKNLVFIRTTLEDPVKVVTSVMEDIAEKKLKRARFAARMLPIVGTCKAQTAAIADLAKDSLASYFSKDNPNAPSCFTVIFKARNNNGTTCGKESVIPAVKSEVLSINPDLKFSWSGFDAAILVEIVCNVCCLGLAPGYDRLRKFNFQQLSQGPRTTSSGAVQVDFVHMDRHNSKEEPVDKADSENQSDNCISTNVENESRHQIKDDKEIHYQVETENKATIVNVAGDSENTCRDKTGSQNDPDSVQMNAHAGMKETTFEPKVPDPPVISGQVQSELNAVDKETEFMEGEPNSAKGCLDTNVESGNSSTPPGPEASKDSSEGLCKAGESEKD